MSNAKIALLVGGSLVLASVSGAAGFYAGGLSQKVAYLERGMAAQPAVAPQQNMGVPYAVAPTLAPAPVPTTAPAPTIAPALTADGVPVQLAPILASAESAGPLLAAVGQAAAIPVAGEIANELPVYAFFDPRCPYCKAAMEELNGKANINWIPVSLLGDLQSGSDMIDGMRTLEGQAAIAAAAEGNIPQATGSQETQGQLQDNAAILFALYKGSDDWVAVPTFLIPRADGTAMFYRGYNAGDAAKILEAYGS